MTHRHLASVVLCPVVNPSGVWSEQAVAGLVGQDVKLHGHDVDGQPVKFECTVVAAYIRDDEVWIDMHMPCGIARFAPAASNWWNEATVGHYIRGGYAD